MRSLIFQIFSLFPLSLSPLPTSSFMASRHSIPRWSSKLHPISGYPFPQSSLADSSAGSMVISSPRCSFSPHLCYHCTRLSLSMDTLQFHFTEKFYTMFYLSSFLMSYLHLHTYTYIHIYIPICILILYGLSVECFFVFSQGWPRTSSRTIKRVYFGLVQMVLSFFLW